MVKPCVKVSQARSAIETLLTFIDQNGCEDIASMYHTMVHFREKVIMQQHNRVKQTTIHEFFKPARTSSAYSSFSSTLEPGASVSRTESGCSNVLDIAVCSPAPQDSLSSSSLLPEVCTLQANTPEVPNDVFDLE